MSRIGRVSTNEPGKNARTGPMSTVKPPLTLPEITPVTISPSSKIFSSLVQVSARLAFHVIKLFDPYRCQELQQLRQQYRQPELQVHVVHLKIQHGQQCLQI